MPRTARPWGYTWGIVQPVFAPRTSRARVSPRLAALLALVLVPLTLVLAFWWAPINEIGLVDGEMQYDFPQKIFYLHVPIALAAYLCFAAGAWNGLLYLLKDREDYDIRSYAGVHSGVVFGTLVLATGSIWAKTSWGVWWNWGDRQLLVFLTLYLFYSAYFVLRFSMDAGRARARTSAVFAVLGVALVPLSFLAIRIADTLIHPIVLTSDGGRLTGPMWGTFGVGVVAFAALAVWMLQLEVAGKLRASRGWCADEEAPGGVRPGLDASDGSPSDSAAAHA
ncbi:MAG: cytochrome c assembly protein [Thermoleophilia bacterium]|nr:cytochrome c assembly protein [Thermoleophilia bacterium]